MTRPVVLALTLALLAIPSASSSAIAGQPSKCDGLRATKVGTDRSQVIHGTKRDDVIVAKGGSDRIFAGAGDDVICAGPGNDIIDGGSGKDRILGGFGNDTLKGGPGKDFLDGGPGRDGCYPAAGGDKLKACEGADLAVTILGPTSVASGDPIDFDVRVTNNGSTRSGSYDLVLSQVQTSVLCGVDHSGTTSFGSVWPGAYAESSYAIPGGCVAQSGSEWYVTITAVVEPANPEADTTDNEATARLDITNSGALPTPTPTPTPAS